jgi:hypothetical protein
VDGRVGSRGGAWPQLTTVLDDRNTLCPDFWICVGVRTTSQRLALLKKENKARSQLTESHSAPWSLERLAFSFGQRSPLRSARANGSLRSLPLTWARSMVLIPIFHSSNCPLSTLRREPQFQTHRCPDNSCVI